MENVTFEHLDPFVQGYLEAILSTEAETTLDFTNFTPCTLRGIIDDCTRFRLENAHALARASDYAAERGKEYSDGQAGADFWLTRNRHGAGFWDRQLGLAGDKLTASAEAFGECTIGA